MNRAFYPTSETRMKAEMRQGKITDPKNDFHTEEGKGPTTTAMGRELLAALDGTVPATTQDANDLGHNLGSSTSIDMTIEESVSTTPTLSPRPVETAHQHAAQKSSLGNA